MQISLGKYVVETDAYNYILSEKKVVKKEIRKVESILKQLDIILT